MWWCLEALHRNEELKSMKVVPDGYHTVTPWMISPGNTDPEFVKAMEFMQGADFIPGS
jgi:hypothetical protein